MEKINRGSEWRRWDLHVHTPGTIKNDQFTGQNLEEKWCNFYTDILNYIGDGTDELRNIATIGITDYLSLDNYKKVVQEEVITKKIDLILPNVEMRIRPIAHDSPINIHFIFEPSIVNDLESRFFSKLVFKYNSTSYSALKDQLIALGRQLNSTATNAEAYILGISQYIPDLDSVKKVFDDDPELRKSTVILVSNSNGDGVTGVATHSSYLENDNPVSQLTLFRYSVYQFVDVIFSAKPSDIKYFLGEGNRDSISEVERKCRTLKPCLHGSDAHSNSRIFEPDEKKYCWIKSEPTFNGLKQVIYEPKERVRISPLKPEIKPSYYVIDRVEIEDDAFQVEPIYFNDKLNCIIGGKSTGKSILIHNIALAIDKKQVIEKTKNSNLKVKELKKIKVFWADQKDEDAKLTQNENHKIVYIPQAYLNRLSDENEEVTEIDNIIQDIILLNPKILEIFNSVHMSITGHKQELDHNIYELIKLKNNMNSIDNELKEIGTETGIINEITKLKKQIEKLSFSLELSQEDIKIYENTINKLREVNLNQKLLQTDIELLKSIDSVVQFKYSNPVLKSKYNDEFMSAVDESINVANLNWFKYKESLISKLDSELNVLNSVVYELEKIKEPLHDKILNNEALSSLTKSVQFESIKLEKYISMKKRYNDINDDFQIILNSTSNSVNFFKEEHQKYLDIVNSNSDLSNSDLEFSVGIPFRTDAFCDKIKQFSDKRSLKNVVDIDKFKESDYTPVFIKSFINDILNKEIPLLKNISIETALRDVLSDWYNVTYSVKMDGDPIELMSPGKKALVLLKLLISLAQSKCPILIDQPEDDLDNRSIYEDLISFIKEKKKERQIIVVTHNANIVLGSDAEEIIIANQNGKNALNKKYRFEYRIGSIEDNLPIIEKDMQISVGILNQQGVQQHICDILEGGEKAFDLRKNKYHI